MMPSERGRSQEFGGNVSASHALIHVLQPEHRIPSEETHVLTP